MLSFFPVSVNRNWHWNWHRDISTRGLTSKLTSN